VQRRRLLPLLRVEIPIARAHCEPIGFSIRWSHAQVDRHVQIRNHALHEDELLVVLLPKPQHVRCDDIEKTTHHGRYAVEVTRPARAAEFAAERRQLHAHSLIEAKRIDLFGFGNEQQIDVAGSRHERGIVDERAWVGGEVLVRTELRGIDEDAHYNARRRTRGQRRQAEMPGMQIAHRRRERHAVAHCPPGSDGLPNRAHGVHRAHAAFRWQT
jgi:hypothetical protein